MMNHEPDLIRTFTPSAPYAAGHSRRPGRRNWFDEWVGPGLTCCSVPGDSAPKNFAGSRCSATGQHGWVLRITSS